MLPFQQRGLADSQATYISNDRSKYIQTLRRGERKGKKTLSTSAYHSQTNPRQTSDCNCNQKKRMKSNTTTDELHDDTLLVLDEKTRLVHVMGQWMGIERDWGIGGLVDWWNRGGMYL